MKKLLSVLLALLLLAAAIPLGAVSVSAATSGTTGNCTWVLNGTALTISGNGAMADYPSGECGPWGTDITSLTIKSGVTDIGCFAFFDCRSLKSVSIPYGVIYIGAFAFESCSSLTSLTIPNSVKYICDAAFSGCALTSLTIPDSVTEIGDAALAGNSLETISIGSGLTYMPNGALYGLYALTTITVSSQNTKFSSSNGVLFNKDKTTLIKYPAKKAGDYYAIPSTVTSIEDRAFEGCSLTSITIPAGLTDLSNMDYGSSLTAINVNAQNSNYSSIDGVLFNKDKTTLIKYPAKKAGDYYAIPDSVTTIDSQAFKDCTSLTSVTIPDSVTSIGSSAFRNCSSLIEVTIPDSVTTIGSSAFYNCTSLTAVSIPDSVTTIGNSTFENCTSLTSIEIPDSVTTIGEDAFEYCTSLTEVTIGDSVTSIASDAFSYCSSLTSISIPANITSIGSWAFNGCSALTDVYYGGTEEDRANITIGSANTPLLNATWHYAPPKGLLYELADGEVTITGYTDELPRELVIPATIEGYPVTTIGGGAFLECPIASVTIPDSVTTIGSAAFSYSGIESILIPAGVTYIDCDAFHACECTFEVAANNPHYSALDGILFNKDQTTIVACGMLYADEYIIPNSVTTIGGFAFFGADINSLTIPDGVISIDDYAFATADVTDVYYGGTEEDRANVAIGSGNDDLLHATWHYHEHTYDDNCDVDCNDCGDERIAPHSYDNACDADCNGCGNIRTPAVHIYDHVYDVDCNVCGDIREVEMPLGFGGNSVSEDVSGLAFKFDVDVLGMTVVDGTTAVYDNATIDGFRLVKMGALVSNSKSEIDIEAVYLCDLEANSVSYAVRIINIPADNYDSVITAIPYFVVEINGVVTTIYGEAQTATFNNSGNN